MDVNHDIRVDPRLCFSLCVFNVLFLYALVIELSIVSWFSFTFMGKSVQFFACFLFVCLIVSSPSKTVSVLLFLAMSHVFLCRSVENIP